MQKTAALMVNRKTGMHLKCQLLEMLYQAVCALHSNQTAAAA